MRTIGRFIGLPAGSTGQPLSISLLSVVLAFLGLGVILWFVHEYHFRAVVGTLAHAGPRLAIVIVVRLAIIVVCSLAWWHLLQGRVALSLTIGLRTIREAVNVLLPVAAGGDVVRARLLNFSGVSGMVAAASTVVDLFLETSAQVLFALIGVALLMRVAGGGVVKASWAVPGFAIAALALAGFYAAQRFGGGWLSDLLARRRFAGRLLPFAAISRLHAALQAIYADRRSLAVAFSLHEFAWLLGSLEIWTALRLMGVPVGIVTSVILESLSQASRAAGFAVPSRLGVQEAAFLALGSVFGIPPDAALALSLVKRVPDFAIGVPGLVAWYWLEIRRLVPNAASSPRRRGQGAGLRGLEPLVRGAGRTSQPEDQDG